METFYSWFGRPAVLSTGKDHGFAVVEPNGPWIIVSRAELESGEVIGSQAEWRARFEPEFGYLDGRKIPRQPVNPHVLLLLARAGQQGRDDDPEGLAWFKMMEERALEAMRTGRKDLPPLN